MTSFDDQRSTGLSTRSLFFGMLILFCLLMTGTTLYVKYNLDRSESALSAPNDAFTPDQSLYEKMIISLGYGGFLGSAQNFMRQHDRTALQDMRMHYKTAQESLLRIGDKASTSVRRDIRGILDLFANVIAKAEEGSDALSPGLTNADLLTATAALNTLDTRLASAMANSRLQAQGHFRLWSLALMMLSVGGFALASALAIWGLWFSGGRYKEELGTLAQSVSNMVHGDNHKAVWGIDRNDKVGELARTIDLARMYFTQIPDVSVMGEDGPIRLKFEGESRSLFQAMMRKLTESFERAQQSSLGFTGAMSAQQDLLKSVVSQMQVSLAEIQRQGHSNEETVRGLSDSLAQASLSLTEMLARKSNDLSDVLARGTSDLTQTLSKASDALAQTARHAAATLTKVQEENTKELVSLVPFMRERIQNMAEVTHLAGTQVTQSLQTLMKSETTFRQSADQSQKTVKQLSDATNQMSERMFAALSLMQATSKALGETIDSSQSRFNEAVDTLARGETNMTKILTRAEKRLESSVNAEEQMAALVSRTASSAEKLETLVGAISTRHEKVDEQILTAAHRMDSIVASFDAAQRVMNESAGQIRRDGSLLGSLLSELRTNNDQLLAGISQNSQTSYTAAQSLAERSHALMQRLEVQIEQQAQMASGRIEELSTHAQSMAQQAAHTTSALTQAITALKAEQEKLSASRTRFSDTLHDLGTKLESHATTTFGKTEKWAAESFSKISSMTEQMEGFMSRLTMLGQLTGTLGTVAGQLGQIVPALTQMNMGNMPMLPSTATLSEQPSVIIDMEGTKELIVQQTEDVLKELHKHWHEAVIQIEAMHDQLAQIVVQQKDQLETRLVVLDKRVKETSDIIGQQHRTQEDDEKRNQIVDEVIEAISKINAHVMALDEVVTDAGLKQDRKEA